MFEPRLMENQITKMSIFVSETIMMFQRCGLGTNSIDGCAENAQHFCCYHFGDHS